MSRHFYSLRALSLSLSLFIMICTNIAVKVSRTEFSKYTSGREYRIHRAKPRVHDTPKSQDSKPTMHSGNSSARIEKPHCSKLQIDPSLIPFLSFPYVQVQSQKRPFVSNFTPCIDQSPLHGMFDGQALSEQKYSHTKACSDCPLYSFPK